MLNQLPVLVVEDEALIALDLVEAIKQVEGVPVGPVATVEEAMRLIDVQPRPQSWMPIFWIAM